MSVRSDKLGPGTIVFGDIGSPVDFATQARNVRVDFNIDEEDALPVLSGDELPGDANETATLAGTMLQSYGLDDFAVYCHVNANAVVPFEFRPRNDRALGLKGECVLRRVSIGGDVKTRNETEFEFPIVGIPDLINAEGQTISTYPGTAGAGA